MDRFGSEGMAHILIVDDQQHVRFLVRLVLEAGQHTLTEAPDGLEALQLLDQTQTPIDLILLDLLMPNLDGFEFLAILRTRPIRPPVIILSAVWNPIPDLPDYPINGELSKPFTQQKLLAAVQQTLSTSGR
jgi:CheY-like chemotaxis protein